MVISMMKCTVFQQPQDDYETPTATNGTSDSASTIHASPKFYAEPTENPIGAKTKVAVQRSNDDHVVLSANSGNTASSTSALPQKEAPSPTTLSPSLGRLRRRWNHYSLQSKWARRLEENQKNCTAPVLALDMNLWSGLGAQLHVWSEALCGAWEKGYRIRSYRGRGRWLWNDESHCVDKEKKTERGTSALSCYFPTAEYRCPMEDGDEQLFTDLTQFIGYHHDEQCKETKATDEGISEYRAASMEYLFSDLSDVVLDEAKRQVGLLFGPGSTAPSPLIAIHIRWGDKGEEMDLVPIDDYVAAVHQIIEQRGWDANNSVKSAITPATVNIYVSTNDASAAQAFRKAADPRWKVYTDITLEELTDSRLEASGYNAYSHVAANAKGRPGLLAMGSLLVALEADNFILTTGSNWSRLWNELRKNVIDPQCGNCTRMIDLRYGEWRD